MGDDVSEDDELNKGNLSEHAPEAAARIDNHADERETAENIAAGKEAAEEGERSPESGLRGPEPMSHAEGKVPARKRPKSEEPKTPWSDGRTFPGTPKNAPCPCGSGRKYKMCHGQNEQCAYSTRYRGAPHAAPLLC